MIVTDPHPTLRAKAAEVLNFGTNDLYVLVAKMRFAMDSERGVGIAAPQIGMSQRVFLGYLRGMRAAPVVCINPVLALGEETEVAEEGCLSLPGIRRKVRRATTCTLTARNVKGEEFTLKLCGLAARIAQHENDHLDGVLIIDKDD